LAQAIRDKGQHAQAYPADARDEAAVACGAFRILTFFVGDALFFGKERLAQAEAALNPA
jgi:2-hydroxychromene-2-carboxylate isomerase